jgi:hypothetical protein
MMDTILISKRSIIISVSDYYRQYGNMLSFLKYKYLLNYFVIVMWNRMIKHVFSYVYPKDIQQ